MYIEKINIFDMQYRAIYQYERNIQWNINKHNKKVQWHKRYAIEMNKKYLKYGLKIS